jgi:DNA invertase Pin-like site-specific DNA recombinase
MFGMMGVFAEFERSMIQARIKARLERDRSAGKTLGRKPINEKVEIAIRARLEAGVGMLKIAHELGVGTRTVQRVQKHRLALRIGCGHHTYVHYR